MDCETVQDQIGAYLDGELPAEAAVELEGHIAGCAICREALARQWSLAEMLRDADSERGASAPANLWAAIEARLDDRAGRTIRSSVFRRFRRPLAAAASLAAFVGVAVFLGVWLSSGGHEVRAAEVDYSVLLDGVAEDVNAAVGRFVEHYSGERIEPASVHEAAPGMTFEIPAELPGGFQRVAVYRLRFGEAVGIAARYQRSEDQVFVFFHPPMERIRLGIHRESECNVAGREGYRVEVGPWKLIHFTTPTTCHCLLSTLGGEADIREIFSAVAPDFDDHTSSGH